MMLPLHHILQKYGLSPKGVLHLGASTGQERDFYKEIGVKKVYWVEALPSVYEDLVRNLSGYENNIPLLACLSNEDDKEVDFYISNNEFQSSSMFELGVHKIVHPEVYYKERVRFRTRRADTLLNDCDTSDLDFLNIDLQGAELLALKGMGNLLKQFKSINVEVNKKETYIGCPLIEEIDLYLLKYGFERVETGQWVGDTWTDAFYLHKSLMS